MSTTDPKPAKKPPQPAAEKEKPAAGGWLAKIAPGVRKLVAKRDTPENLWVKCPDTGEMIYRPDLEAAWWVTPSGRHMRIAKCARRDGDILAICERKQMRTA